MELWSYGAMELWSFGTDLDASEIFYELLDE